MWHACFVTSDLQSERLGTLKREFMEEQATLMEEFDTERAMLIEQHMQEMNDLQDIMFAMEQNFNERENEAKSDFHSMRDEIKNKVPISLLTFKVKCNQVSHLG